jgi:hypothetical protein
VLLRAGFSWDQAAGLALGLVWGLVSDQAAGLVLGLALDPALDPALGLASGVVEESVCPANELLLRRLEGRRSSLEMLAFS